MNKKYHINFNYSSQIIVLLDFAQFHVKGIEIESEISTVSQNEQYQRPRNWSS